MVLSRSLLATTLLMAGGCVDAWTPLVPRALPGQGWSGGGGLGHRVVGYDGKATAASRTGVVMAAKKKGGKRRKRKVEGSEAAQAPAAPPAASAAPPASALPGGEAEDLLRSLLEAEEAATGGGVELPDAPVGLSPAPAPFTSATEVAPAAPVLADDDGEYEWVEVDEDEEDDDAEYMWVEVEEEEEMRDMSLTGPGNFRYGIKPLEVRFEGTRLAPRAPLPPLPHFPNPRPPLTRQPDTPPPTLPRSICQCLRRTWETSSSRTRLTYATRRRRRGRRRRRVATRATRVTPCSTFRRPKSSRRGVRSARRCGTRARKHRP